MNCTEPAIDKATVCPVCKKPWRPWAGTTLRCHYRCLHTAIERQEILRRFEARVRSIDAFALEEGTAKQIMTAVLALARRERLEAQNFQAKRKA